MPRPLRSGARHLLLTLAVVLCLQAADDASQRDPDPFATRTDISPELHAAYGAVIAEAARRRNEGCNRGPCEFRPGDPLYEQVARLGTEPTGQLLIAVGKNLGNDLVLEPGWIELAIRHPAAQDVLQSLLDYTEEIPLLVAMFAKTDPARWVPESIVSAADRAGTLYGPQAWEGWFDTFLDVAEQRATQSGAPLDVRAAIAQLAVAHELQLGLTTDAVRRYMAYPTETRTRLPITVPRDRGGCGPAVIYTFTDDLAAALWQTGHRDDARAMLREEYEALGPRSPISRLRFAALADSIVPAVPTAELFDRYLVPDKTMDDLCTFPNRMGWFDAVSRSPAIRPLAATRLRQAGYNDMAEDLNLAARTNRSETIQPSVLAGYARFFPNTVAAQHARWVATIDTAWRTTLQRPASPAPVQVKARAALASWTERPLPRGIAAWRDTDSPARPPKNLSLPVDPDAIVRYEATGREHAIVYQSSDYEMPGEIPAYGIWFARTEQGRWTPPVYLGLRQYSPYVVTSGSKLPLVVGNRLQIEVRIREIDPDTIIFPPVATGLKRSADGRYLTIDLAQARADRDADGLTDIEERALGLDPANADSDRDGFPDGSDAMPLTAHRSDAPAGDIAIARAVINQLLGQDAEAIVHSLPDGSSGLAGTTLTRARTFFLVGDPRIFAGIGSAPFRLVVYSDDDLRTLARGEPFYPPRLTHVFSSLDGRRHYVDWSASWAGGRFVVTCSANGSRCESEELSSWVS